MLKTLRLALALCALAFLMAGGAYADTVQFDGNGAGGAISFKVATGGTASITNGVIDEVTNLDNLVNLPVTGSCSSSSPVKPSTGCITLTTGAYLSNTIVGTAHTVLYEATGSSLVITGTAGTASGTLLSTVFKGANIVLKFDTSTHGGSIEGLLDSGMMNPTLAAELGVLPGTTGISDNNSFFHLSWAPPNGTGTVNQSTVQVTAVVPEPSSIALFGTLLLGVAGLARKKLGKK